MCHQNSVKRLFVVMVLSVVLATSFANKALAANPSTVSFSNYRGINVYFHSGPKDADFSRLAGWGVNIVRLSIHANPLRRDYDFLYKEDGETYNETAFVRIDRVLDMAAKHNIKVIVATTSFPGSVGEVWADYRNWEKLVGLWTYMAQRYKGHSAVIGYHPIDEPALVRRYGSVLDRLLVRSGHWSFPDEWKGTPKDYFGLVENVGQAINRVDPDKVVVVSGVGNWGHASNYEWMRPVNVRNAIYSFNLYIPDAFANSGKKGKPKVSYNSRRQRFKLLEKIRPVQNFAKKYNSKILVVGFGLPFHTEGMGARDWMNDMLGFFEKNKWSWTYFSYGISFRSPEVVGRDGKGKLIRREDTERLSVLKQYWHLNSAN